MRGRTKSEAKRQAIIRCATEVFSERPYHEVLTEDLCSRLKIGKGTLYRYFASKEDLYFATIVEGLRGMSEAIADALGQSALLDQTIEALARTIIGYFWERRDFFVLLHRHETKLDAGERAEWQQGREAIVTMVAERLERELGLSAPPDIKSRLAAEMLFGMIRSVCVHREETDRIEDLARLVAGVFLAGFVGVGAESAARRRAALVS